MYLMPGMPNLEAQRMFLGLEDPNRERIRPPSPDEAMLRMMDEQARNYRPEFRPGMEDGLPQQLPGAWQEALGMSPTSQQVSAPRQPPAPYDPTERVIRLGDVLGPAQPQEFTPPPQPQIVPINPPSNSPGSAPAGPSGMWGFADMLNRVPTNPALSFGPTQNLGGVQARDAYFETPESFAARRANPDLPTISTPQSPLGNGGAYSGNGGGGTTWWGAPQGSIEARLGPRPLVSQSWDSPQEQARLLAQSGIYGQRENALLQALQAARTDETTRLNASRSDETNRLGMGFLPGQTASTAPAPWGSLAVNQRQVENAGRAADIQHGPDAVNERAYQLFAQSEIAAQRPDPASIIRRWLESGRPRPVSLGGPSQSQFQHPAGALPQVGQQSQNQPANQPANQPQNGNQGQASPQTTMENALSQVIPVQAGQAPRVMESDDITRLIHRLGPDFVSQNVQAVEDFLRQRAPTLQDWYTATDMRGSGSLDARARAILRDAYERRQPGSSGGTSMTNPQSSWWRRFANPLGLGGEVGRPLADWLRSQSGQ